jgi:hypothetical protein
VNLTSDQRTRIQQTCSRATTCRGSTT